MIKYTRSIQKLCAKIEEILQNDTVTLDTRVIVLLLSATLASKEFNQFIDNIRQLDVLNSRYKEVNTIRFLHGNLFRDYIILAAIKAATHEVSTGELHRFISAAEQTEQNAFIAPALELATIQTDSIQTSNEDHAFLKIKYLIANYIIDMQDTNDLSLKILQDAYLHSRQHASASDAYYGLLAALIDIFRVGGLSSECALQRARRLADWAIRDFVQIPMHNKSILHNFSKQQAISW